MSEEIQAGFTLLKFWPRVAVIGNNTFVVNGDRWA